ncbi:hypothetical protein EIN_367940 [Entamoeba invadens IP1]|uniref:Uncharacterized protein n=1 Tax=Entamoeba invadens IP1 TaxID=370355 RepID=L7FKT3_ENTIV|nr:hypothetical protein EIN_367940 [Entamoeba invadens IP1]ELP84941.1 hypothetical protein EIN_367940 [Entamoeba invadens IP1]|eukprot:XP_004184287.1 hypothetical protein EIN_367940 [Entamoeba invadens IP1]
MSSNCTHNPQLSQSVVERSTLTNLQCALLAFLSIRANVIIAKPQKSTKFSKQFLVLRQINFTDENFIFDVNTFVTKRIQDRMNIMRTMGLSDKTAYRKTMNFKKREVLEVLEDLLFEEGFIVLYQKINREGVRGDISIKMPNGKVIGKEIIMKLGNNVWDFCLQKFKKSKKIVLNSENVLGLIHDAYCVE